jgi:hypothetical protein
MAAAIIADREGGSVAQFRVEFLLDEATGKYFAELYDPANQSELVARTEALYASQAAAVLGLVQLFKDAVLNFPKAAAKPRVRKAAKKKKPARKAKKSTRRKKK